MAGTAGIGREALRQLAKHKPAQLYFSGRSESSAAKVVAELKAIDSTVNDTFIECDLGSRASIVESLKGFTWDRLDVLIANAGLCAVMLETT